MTRFRFSLLNMAIILAVLALDMAVFRSLVRPLPGSNQTMYTVPIDSTHWLSFVAFALGVLPMATLIVPATILQVLQAYRTGGVSSFGLGFVAFGWLSMFLFMVLAALSPPGAFHYLEWVNNRLGPPMLAILGDRAPRWIYDALEFLACIVGFGLPQLAIAMVGGRLLRRSHDRIGIESNLSETSTVEHVGSSVAASIGG